MTEQLVSSTSIKNPDPCAEDLRGGGGEEGSRCVPLFEAKAVFFSILASPVP